MSFPIPTTQQLAQYILDFLDHIEGAGYGGMAEFEIARISARDLAGANAQPRPAPVAWRLTDGEGDYEYLTEEPSDQSRAWSRRYGREWEPLYASPVPSTPLCTPAEGK